MKEEFNQSYCHDIEEYGSCFGDYHGIKNALCGKSGTKKGNERFITKRIIVIQMKD